MRQLLSEHRPAEEIAAYKPVDFPAWIGYCLSDMSLGTSQGDVLKTRVTGRHE